MANFNEEVLRCIACQCNGWPQVCGFTLPRPTHTDTGTLCPLENTTISRQILDERLPQFYGPLPYTEEC